jgi:phage-related protein
MRVVADEAEPESADIWWWGTSKEILSDFPADVKRNLGFALRMLQVGDEPPHYRHLRVFGAGVYELREQDDQAWYRVVYLSRVENVIHVLHAFKKKSREIPQNDVKAIKQNLKQFKAWLLQEKKNAKRG